MGFTIDKGASVWVSEGDSNTAYYNKQKINFQTVELVIKKLTKKKIRVEISSPLPLGAGFGMSGASALATAYALNKLLNLDMEKKELAMIAHCAEVEAGSGLGDVVNQFYGGFLAKFEPSWKFRVKRIKMEGKKVFCKFFSKISTKKIITNRKKRNIINIAGKKALSSLGKMMKRKKKPLFAELIALSKTFALESGLLSDTRVLSIIEGIEGRNGHASMIMLGNSVFSDRPFPGSMIVKISNKGAL